MTEEVQRLLHHLPAVVARATDEWAKGFARSVLRQSRRRDWRPSAKQLGVMRELVAQLFREPEEGGPVVLEPWHDGA